jgi:hypothetical protein
MWWTKALIVLVVLLCVSFSLNLVLLGGRVDPAVGERRSPPAPPMPLVPEFVDELRVCRETLNHCDAEREELWLATGAKVHTAPATIEPSLAAAAKTLKESDIFVFVPFMRETELRAVVDSWAWAFYPSVHFVESYAASSGAVSQRTVSLARRQWSVVRVPQQVESLKTLCSKVLMYLQWACMQPEVRRAPWLYKADTDTVVMHKNLVAALNDFNPDVPHYFGYIWRMVPFQLARSYTWADGGAGYVLSRAAFGRLCDSNFTGMSSDKADEFRYEDVLVGHLLERVGVTPNMELRQKFSHFPPSEWVKRRIDKLDAVSFHGIKDPACLTEIGAIVDYVTGTYKPA